MSIFEEVNFIDGVQEFLESEYVTILLDKNTNVFQLRGVPSQDSIRFSGDVTLFKKQVYSENDLTIPSSWYLYNVDDEYYIKIDPSLKTSDYTFTYVTYKSRAISKKEGLYSVDYNKGILYLSTPLKRVKVVYRKAVQYIEGQMMKQVERSEYNKNTVFNIPVDADTRLSYIYQIKNTPANIKSKEINCEMYDYSMVEYINSDTKIKIIGINKKKENYF